MTSIPENIGPGITHIGTDVLDNDKQKKNRLKRQECPTCGMKLFKISGNALLANTPKKKQTPFLCKTGKTVSGRCLMCHPLEIDEQEEHCSSVPKIIVGSEGDEESQISDITLDRRLLQGDDEYRSTGVHSYRAGDDYSRGVTGVSTTSLTKVSRPSKASQFDDHDYESLTESENDDDGANPRRKSPQHRSGRSMNNSSHHNVVSLSSSARNRWGESENGLDADLSTGPRPLPPKRVPSGDGEKNQNHSLHHSLPSRVTATTACNTTEDSPNQRPISPRQRSSSPNQRSNQNPTNRIPRIIIPNSPTKKSNFTPPWNPKSQNNETSNARKPGDIGKPVDEKPADNNNGKEIVFISEDRKDPVGGKPAVGGKTNKTTGKDRQEKEFNLFGIHSSGPQPIPDFDEKAGNNSSNRRSDGGKVEEPEHVRDIHVDLTSFTQRSRKIASPTKDVTPRTLKRQKALTMLVPMEQIFPPEHVTSVKPPKKVLRATSTEAAAPSNLEQERFSNRDCLPNLDKPSDDDGNIKNKSIKQLLSLIGSQESPDRKVATLRVMTDMIWLEDEGVARREFTTENGMEVLTSILWNEMMHPQVQTAVLKLLFALANKPCTYLRNGVAPLSEDGVDVIIDALLITMEQHACIEELQLLGCQVLCCLSSELSAVSDINDGTRSGACLAVLTAMEAHRDAIALQEWGIRAIYNQCVHSRHAELNKRLILSSKLVHPLCSDGSGRPVTGGDVLLRVLKSSARSRPTHGLILEWSCKLYNSLAASRESTELLSPAPDLLRSLLNLVHKSNLTGTDELIDLDSMDTVEKSLSTISRLLNIDLNKSCIDVTDVFLLMLDTMTNKKDNLEIVQNCCSILSKLAPDQSLRKDALPCGRVVRRILNAMMGFPDVAMLQECGMRTLASLSLGSESMKEHLSAKEALDSLIGLFHTNADVRDPALIQETMCTLIATLLSSELWQEQALQCDTLETLRKAMERSKSNVKLQEVAVVALMNLSTGVHVNLLVELNTIELIVTAMEWNATSTAVQKNACSALWNIGVNTDTGKERLRDTKAIKCIASAVQNHIQNQDVVDVACGCLWSLCEVDDVFKDQLLMIDGSMETIAWTLVMYADCPVLQEKSCGVLSTVSSRVRDTNANIASMCISHLTDAIRRNPKSLPVLHACTRFLRPILQFVPEHCSEVCDVVPILISAMKEYMSSKVFQQDSCNLLRTIGEKSSDAKERIRKMEGISALIGLLDKNHGDEILENGALEAFQELTLAAAS